jgi:RecA-family ATPase
MNKLKDLLIDLETNKENIKRWLIRNLMGYGEITIMYAKWGSLKTGMAIKIAMEVATGGQELGHSLSGNVLYCSLDTPKIEMLFRQKALMENRYQDHLEEIGSNLSIRFDGINLTKDTYLNDRLLITWHDFGRHIGADGTKLIIIDTLSKALVGSGVNDDAVVRKVIHNLREIIRGSNNEISILVIHHSGKNLSKGMMGSSVLSNDISTVLKISKTKDGFNLIREKHKSSHEGKSIPFKARSVVYPYEKESYEAVYVDIGSGLSPVKAEIVSQYKSGKSKKDIMNNIKMLQLYNTTTTASFSSCFYRDWKNLIGEGFLPKE